MDVSVSFVFHVKQGLATVLWATYMVAMIYEFLMGQYPLADVIVLGLLFALGFAREALARRRA